MSDINLKRIEKMTSFLEAALSPTYLNITDDSHLHVGHKGAQSGAGHFSVHISAPIFTGKSPISQHQLVYKALASMMQEDIHALSIHTKVPD